MFKKILLLVIVTVMSCYICLVLIFSGHVADNNICSSVEVCIENSADASIVSGEQIEKYLRNKRVNTVGYRLSDINLDSIESVVRRHPLVKDAECYISPSNNIVVEIWQKIPILRVIANSGESYYMDKSGDKIDKVSDFVSYVPLVTGNVTHDYVRDNMLDFVSYIYNDSFWNSQIEQIHVNENKDIILVPRVGDNLIYLGKEDYYVSKLERIKVFYKKALSVVGWNKYKDINVEFENQVVAEKR